MGRTSSVGNVDTSTLFAPLVVGLMAAQTVPNTLHPECIMLQLQATRRLRHMLTSAYLP
jgi:hypothetical protein